MTDFLLVYDARAEPLLHVGDFAMVPMVIAFVAVFLFRRYMPAPPESRPTWIDRPAAVAAAVAIAVLAGGGLTVGRYLQVKGLQDHLSSGDYVVVEGRVENFVRGDKGGHKEESWSVRSGGRLYTYRYKWSTVVPGFHGSAGPIREGLHVRLADVDGYIARLEIRQ
jgi:hypothetical protein